MTFAHLRLRRRLALLAAGVLDPEERDETRAHVEACARCRREYAELQAVVSGLADDPVRGAEPELPVAVMIDRVERAIERGEAKTAGPTVGWRLALPGAVAAALALFLLGPHLASRFDPAPPAPTPTPIAAIPTEVLDRLERNMTREHAARYLSDAQDVLLAVAATEVDCERANDRIDVGEAPDRSRRLLARRALLVEGRPEALASARTVLDEVELALREVAELPSCVRRSDVRRFRQAIDRRHLHMRIRLMTRELEG